MARAADRAQPHLSGWRSLDSDEKIIRLCQDHKTLMLSALPCMVWCLPVASAGQRAMQPGPLRKRQAPQRGHMDAIRSQAG